MQQVTVRVPASTSNLGPGFDCLGVALRIYNDVIVTRGEKSRLPAIAHAAPAVFGGFTVVREKNVQRFHVSTALSFVLLIPNFEVETSAARKILPPQITRAAAIKNSANSSAITAAFASGNYQNLRGAFRDRLHQPYRKKLIPFLPRVITAAEKAGALGAFLSGSGSTIAAVTLTNPEKIAEAMHRKVENHTARTVIVSADNRGARLVQSPISSH